MGAVSPVSRLEFAPGQVVQEFGWDDDVDDSIRMGIEGVAELVDEDYDDVSDAVIIWYRADDDDLGDTLVDSMNMLEDGGAIWLFTPKPGRAGYVDHAEIAEAANLTGLHATNTFDLAKDWTATALANRGRRR
ncbi:MAG: DUF3052 domain-containing protein [Promicromonosporaceae bacterium]|nr:DUF3052 domain-containing protein [Promicromonosporaceae bacterium]